MRPGENVGDYRIVSKIGEGGMSVVYLAEHGSTSKHVVVKELKEQYRSNQQLVDRFLREAEILQGLRHPHLARVFDVIEHDGKHCIVQEYLSGGSLADLLQKQVSYTRDEAIRWSRDALRAMNYAHENGIVHRDLKPSNLMLDDNGQVRVIDFGIARAFGQERLTRTSDGSIGTLEYMSPEQILTPQKVDHLTDVYSMGIVLYELLSGRVPFEGETPFSIQEKITRQSPPPLTRLGPGITASRMDSEGVPQRLAGIVLRAIEKGPENRFGGCAEFALALDRFLTPAAQSSEQGRRPLVIAAVLATVLLVAVLGWWSRTKTSSPADGEQTRQVDPADITGTRPATEKTSNGVAAGPNQGGGETASPPPPADTERERREMEQRQADQRRAEGDRLRTEQDAADRRAERETARIAQQQEADRVAKQQEADRLAGLERQREADRLANQQEADRLAKQQEADRQAQLRKQQEDRLAKQQEADRVAKQQEADRLAKQQEADRLAKQQEADRLAKQQEADRLAAQRRSEQQQAESRIFASVIGTWKRHDDQNTNVSRTVTDDVLNIRQGCVGSLTRTVTRYEKGFSGWKRIGDQTSQFTIRCDAAGRVTGDLDTQLSSRGATLTLGSDTYVRSN